MDKIADHDKPHFSLFCTTILTTKKIFFSERELKKALRDTLTRAAWFGTLINNAGPSKFWLVRSEHAHLSYPGLTELKNDCACVTGDPVGEAVGAKNRLKQHISNEKHSVSWLRSKISVGVQVWNRRVQEICLITLTGRSFGKVWSLSDLPKSYLR